MTADTHATTEREVAELIDGLRCIWGGPHEIRPDEPLFSEGWGSNRSMRWKSRWPYRGPTGVELRSDDDQVRQVFASLRNLTRYIDAHQIR